jgi:hypothetical protein
VRLALTVCNSGSIFYEGTADAQRYVNEILNPFFITLPTAEEKFG